MIRVREATVEDYPAIVEAVRQAFAPVAVELDLTRDNCPGHPSFYSLERLEKDLEYGKRFHVALHEGLIVGCVTLRDLGEGSWEVGRVTVRPAWQKQGLGRMLLDHAHRIAERLGARQTILDVFAQKQELVRWYQGQDYQIIDLFRVDTVPRLIARMRRRIYTTGLAQTDRSAAHAGT
jgi:diamine N-acetyltransferase